MTEIYELAMDKFGEGKVEDKKQMIPSPISNPLIAVMRLLDITSGPMNMAVAKYYILAAWI